MAASWDEREAVRSRGLSMYEDKGACEAQMKAKAESETKAALEAEATSESEAQGAAAEANTMSDREAGIGKD